MTHIIIPLLSSPPPPQMGLDGFFFARIDYDDKNKRLGDKTMEMVWRPSASLGAESDIFTGVLYSGYGPPSGFCWDVRCSDTPIQVGIMNNTFSIQKQTYRRMGNNCECPNIVNCEFSIFRK